MFSMYKYDLDSLINHIRFLKNNMIICPPEIDANVSLLNSVG